MIGQPWRQSLRAWTRGLAVIACGWVTAYAAAQTLGEHAVAALVAQFDAEVDRRLAVPVDARQRYAEGLDAELHHAQITLRGRQHLVLVDRNPNVQAVAVLLFDPPARWIWIGASAVSTGRPGEFDHFITPTGVFAHSLDNPDFRAEGTFNENHIRGYGLRGTRVFDFGWVQAERGWGSGGLGTMRLQMHATDSVLELRLGTAQSKGCIRITAALNRYLDRHGIIDADYEEALARGKPLWVLATERTPTRWPGRYLAVIDSHHERRPVWSPIPMKSVRRKPREAVQGRQDGVPSGVASAAATARAAAGCAPS